MWNFLWPDWRVEDVPITHIGHAIHAGTWLARRDLSTANGPRLDPPGRS
jgi:hypothetical protein